MLNSKVVPLKAVIPVGSQWHVAKKHQAKHVQHYLGFLRNGSKNFVIIDKSSGEPVLEAEDRKYPMQQDIHGTYHLPQIHHGLKVKLNGLSGMMILS